MRPRPVFGWRRLLARAFGLLALLGCRDSPRDTPPRSAPELDAAPATAVRPARPEGTASAAVGTYPPALLTGALSGVHVMASVAAVVLADSMALMLDVSGERMVDALDHDMSPGHIVWPAQPGAESLRLLGVDDAGRALLLLPMRGWMIREATSGARTPLGRVAPLPERTPVCLGVTRLWYVDRTGSQVAVVGVPVGDGAPEPRAERRHVLSAASSRRSPLRLSGGGSGPCVAWHTDHDTLLVLDDRVDSVHVIRVDRAPPPTLWRARTAREFVRRLRAPTPVAFLDVATDHQLLALLEPVDSTGTHRIRFVRHSGDSAGVMRVRQRAERLALANDRLYLLAREEHGLRLHWFVRPLALRSGMAPVPEMIPAEAPPWLRPPTDE